METLVELRSGTTEVYRISRAWFSTCTTTCQAKNTNSKLFVCRTSIDRVTSVMNMAGIKVSTRL